MAGALVSLFIIICAAIAAGVLIFLSYRKSLREAKNYERGLKMVPMLIHLPPASDDITSEGRDQRDLTEEILSQSQVMYNIIASTATKGFKSKVYGQRHMSFEIIVREGLVYYYAVVPTVLTEVISQAISAAYPSARLEEVTEHNVFSQVGKMSGTIGGEFTLKKKYAYPIATYMESKRDASRALLNAVTTISREDGVGIQFLIRPADEGWAKKARTVSAEIVKNKGEVKPGIFGTVKPIEILESLWKPPSVREDEEKSDKQISATDQATVDAIEEKTRYPGYEVLVRVVVSSNTAARSQAILKNIVAAFALFNSPAFNGFKFSIARDIDELVTSYIFRFFPQQIKNNILNSVELATIFHLPDQSAIPTSQVKRQMSKQVDGPTQVMEDGLLLGYNEFRGVKKPIRLEDKDRRRHIHIIGQTGVGKSVLQENLAYQDMEDGRGFAFVDPHGDSVEALLSKVPPSRVEDVIYFNPSDMSNPIGLNMFEFDHPDQKDFLVQEAISMLYGLYDPGHTGIVGPRLEHIFRNCALLLMSDPQGGTFIDIPKLLIDEEFMKSKLKYVTDQQVLDFWTKEFPASQRSSESGEVISWVVSKFGPFISNDAMRNIIGQRKSGFDIADIMNNRKILLVNLSKGKMGDLNSKLLGIIFVMKFQAAAMARANMPEDQRQDFTLYVDEFQNFATDSFETILSEARKYRLSLVLGNQFMTQLKEELREAIIGNVGTTITGRIGITDAEIMVKRYAPVFDAEDLTKLPNFESVCVAQIQGVPSAPFSMSWIAPMGEESQELADALKRLSAAKYGRPRGQVEKEIFDRLKSPPKTAVGPGGAPGRPGLPGGAPGGPAGAPKSGSSFLDEWLTKRKQLAANKAGIPAPLNAPMAPPAGAPVPNGPTPTIPSGMPYPAHPQQTAPAPAPQAPYAAPAPMQPGPSQAQGMPSSPYASMGGAPSGYAAPAGAGSPSGAQQPSQAIQQPQGAQSQQQAGVSGSVGDEMASLLGPQQNGQSDANAATPEALALRGDMPHAENREVTIKIR